MTAYVHTTSFGRPQDIEFSQAWIANAGTHCVDVALAPHCSITLHSTEEADALVTAAADAKAAMQALADGKHAWRCGTCRRLIVTSGERPESRACDACALPPVAPEPSAGCDGAHPDGEWLCTAIAGHEPLDHVSYDPDGEIVARWPSVRPAGGEPVA